MEKGNVFISVSAGVEKTSKGIKNLRSLPQCGPHLFNGIKMDRQTEHENPFQKLFDECAALSVPNFKCIVLHAALKQKRVNDKTITVLITPPL